MNVLPETARQGKNIVNQLHRSNEWLSGNAETALLVIVAVVAVMVAVAVSVAIAVVAEVGVVVGRAVEDDREPLVFVFGEPSADLDERLAVEELRTDHKERDVGIRVDDRCVGYDLYRRAVDEDVVVVLAEAVEQLLHTGRREKLRRVGRHRAARQDIDLSVTLHERTIVRFLSVEVVGDAFGMLVDTPRQHGTAQVEVERDDALSPDAEGCGEVEGDERLAAAGVERSQHHYVRAVAVGVERELQIGSHHPERLVDEVAVLLGD